MSLPRRAAIVLVPLIAACSRKADQPAPEQSNATPSPTTASPSITPTPTPSATPTPTPTPTPSASPDVLPAGVVNVLFFGTDSREKSSLVGNADSLVLAQLSADRSQLALVSIARDTYVKYAGGGSGKINGSFPAGGTDKLKNTVAQAFGDIPIHFTVQTHFTGMIAITRWLGGIEVDNKHSTTVKVISTGRVVTFPKGKLTLSGTDALIYARERKTMPLGDLDRAQRHRAVLTGMVRKLKQKLASDPAGFAALMKSLFNNVKLTGPLDGSKLSGLIPALKAVKADRVISLMLPISRFGMINGASVDIIDERRSAELATALKAGDVSGYAKKYGESYALTGG